MWACGHGHTERQTDRHTHTGMCMTTIRFTLSTTHAKCNDNSLLKPMHNIMILQDIQIQIKIYIAPNSLIKRDRLLLISLHFVWKRECEHGSHLVQSTRVQNLTLNNINRSSSYNFIRSLSLIYLILYAAFCSWNEVPIRLNNSSNCQMLMLTATVYTNCTDHWIPLVETAQQKCRI